MKREMHFSECLLNTGQHSFLQNTEPSYNPKTIVNMGNYRESK